jgi:hypothetical protein
MIPTLSPRKGRIFTITNVDIKVDRDQESEIASIIIIISERVVWRSHAGKTEGYDFS